MFGCLFRDRLALSLPAYMLCMVVNLVLDHSGGKDTYIGMILGGQGAELALLSGRKGGHPIRHSP